MNLLPGARVRVNYTGLEYTIHNSVPTSNAGYSGYTSSDSQGRWQLLPFDLHESPSMYTIICNGTEVPFWMQPKTT